MVEILDMSGSDDILDMSDPIKKKKKRMSKSDAMWFAGKLGVTDTLRGVQQLADVNVDEMKEEQRLLRSLEDEHGWGVKGAYMAGLVADPVGWMLPVSRIKHLRHAPTIAKWVKNIVLPGAASGAVAGGLGYVDEDLGITRPQQAALGTAGGAVLGPVAAGVAMGGSKLYEPIGKALWKGMSTRMDASGATVGGAVGYNVDPDAPIEDKIVNTLIGVAVGGTAGYAGSKKMSQGRKDQLGRFFIPDYGLADDFIARRSKFYGDRKAIGGEFDALVREVSEFAEPQRKALYRMLTDKEATVDEALVGLKGRSREVVEKYGRELRDMGLIDKDTFMKNRDTYLHRTYTRHENDKFLGTGDKIQTIGDELKLRGLKQVVPVERYNAMKAGTTRFPEGGPWDVIARSENGKNVTIRRDWTKEERLKMGEIVDAAQALDTTGKLLANDVSAFRFFKDIANDPKVASELPTDAFTRQVNNASFGPALNGKYVSESVYKDLMGIRKLNSLATYKKNPLVRNYRKLNSMWKGSKTIMNPAVHMNNILSNVHMYDMADGNVADVARAARDMWRKSDDFNEAQNLGVFGGFFTSELGNDAVDLAKLYSTRGRGMTDDPASIIGTASEIARKSFGLAKKYSWDKAAKVYTMEDQIFRMALFRSHRDDLIRRNIDPETAARQAAKKAREWFVDYERTAPMLELLREGPLPFVSYMYGIVPRLAETAAKKPMKLAKWGLIWHGINSLGEDMSDKSPEALAKQRRLMSNEKQRGLWGLPGMPSPMIKMPDVISPKGRDDWYMDIGRMIPGGDIYSMSEGGIGQVPYLPKSLQPGFGAAGALAFPAFGIEGFLGRKVPKGEKLEQAIKNFTPNWPIPGFPSWAGQKIKRAGYSFDNEIKEKESKKRKLVSEKKAGGITATELAKQLSQLNRDIRELKREKRRKQAGIPQKPRSYDFLRLAPGGAR